MSRPRIVLERESGSTDAVARSAHSSVAKTIATFAQYCGAMPVRRSRSTTDMVASERQAKTIEWRRNSGQMRLPSLIRTFGIRKMSDDTESARCHTMISAVKFESSKRMSLNG